jgi:hypothetical protein
MQTTDIHMKIMIVLHNGRVVDGDFYDTAFMLAKGSTDYLLTCNQLDGSEEFTTEMLCGDDQWSQWSDTEKQTVGRCIASMSTTGILPLKPVPCGAKHKSPKTYRLKK